MVVGAVGAAFEHALEWATETRQEYSWTLYFLPLVGLFIAFWYSKMDMPLERGTNFILTSVRQDHPVRLRLAPSIFITSVLTHLCGRLCRTRRCGAAARRCDFGQYRTSDAPGRQGFPHDHHVRHGSVLFGAVRHTACGERVRNGGYQRGRDVLRGAGFRPSLRA